ncbi:uncharacterized protein LOC130669110 [Microplitis mediator]|uniref:uncharacterized protein LOC130669110 n=1 Tax=Microplitis mediator TaxID=375433 RepID=UPI0025571A75|nr:uncharacterized protein LOC130669110 [Microplitis mediator]
MMSSYNDGFKKDNIDGFKNDSIEQKSRLIDNSTSTTEKTLNLFDIKSPDWILPIFFRNTSEPEVNWKYDCQGVLINPKAVLTVGYCAQPLNQVAYAIGTFSRKIDSNEIYVNYDQLHSVSNITDYRTYNILKFCYSGRDKNKCTKPEYGLVVMILDRAINSVNPVDISPTSLMTLHDLYDDTIERECIHITFTQYPNAELFAQRDISEKTIDRPTLFEKYSATLKTLNKSVINGSFEFDPNNSLFGTIDNLKVNSTDDKYFLLGSPIVCRVSGKETGNFSLAGLLANSMYSGIYEYTNIHHEIEWIQKKLEEISS